MMNADDTQASGKSADSPFSSTPVPFDALSSRNQKLSASDFRGKVPVVLSFVLHGDKSDSLIRSFDAEHLGFGERRVQLIVVVDTDPLTTAERLGVQVPLMADNGLAAELNAEPDDQGRVCSIILATDGVAIEAVRQQPADDQALAVFVALDRLAEQYPERFSVLPETSGPRDRVDNPISENSATTHPGSEDS